MSDKYKRYHKIAKIGTGGMGAVYRVLDMDLGRECAMKCVPLQREGESYDDEHLPSGRLNREVTIMTGIQDSNVVYIYDHFHYENQLCIVMELCQISVADWVHQREPFSLVTTIDMGVQMLSALSVIHGKGVVHRDIKPHNILISLSGKQFKLTDFGLAALRDASMILTQSGVFAGTIAFMAPEQRLSFKDVTPQADLYSLAMTMQWVLFGELKGDLYSARTLSMIEEEIRIRDWPRELLDFFEHAGKEDPTERFDSADAMRKALIHLSERMDGGSVGMRLTPIDLQSVHRFESKLSSPSMPIHNQSSLSTEEMQAQTNRWLKGIMVLIALMLLVIVGLGVWALKRDPISENLNGQMIGKSETPACSQMVEIHNRFRRLGPRETQDAGMMDVNRDGFVDAVYVNQQDQSLSIYWGNKDFVFDSSSEIQIGRSHTLPLLGDVNQDGKLDFVSLHGDEAKFQTHLQQGDRTWESAAEDFQAPPPRKGALVDLNRDGWLDLMFTVPGLPQNIQYRLGSQEGFLGHSPLGEVPGVVFIPNEPWMVYIDGEKVMRRDVNPNLSLTPPLEIAAVQDLEKIFPIQIKGERFLYGLQKETHRLIQLSAEPCWILQLTAAESMRISGLGDWNQDGILDWTGFATCAGCTSNHLLHLGGLPSILPSAKSDTQ